LSKHQVDGVVTEFKTLALTSKVDSNTIGTGLTKAEALRGLARMKNLSRGKLDSVRIIGNGFG
jgi:hypothetical protein